MKTTKQLICLMLLSASLFTACKKDNDNDSPAPSIDGLEVGTSNNKTAHPGNDLHIEAQITAPGTIKDVVLEIHPESGDGWKVNTTYTENLAGQKNAEFHEHIDVPATTAVGNYHGHIKVTDENGKVTEADFDLKVIADPTLPSVTGFEVGLNTAGNDLHAEATINAPNKIAKVVLEVHGAGWEKEVTYTDAAMVGKVTYNLHKHVDVTGSPKGHYHVHLKVIDQAGKENEFEEHFDKP
ncbi:DUF4625 domain-containing protein [Mucilaginibacter aquatilis]|uniref:DUF4625 domain-containing protein n=1 Tax=Mucilaginibacter aquatilis TaxID=1517760 RepID=A0A6I4IQG6_9SPHI|nr:DUF4625 domain-containing protein [Mucilaginibacter aquatilis]MVN91114.1 DUF4625 domain-containing protein [Mucilaginibacter aquatilis]